jgi:capsular exopolysaccharide synthesis family protein
MLPPEPKRFSSSKVVKPVTDAPPNNNHLPASAPPSRAHETGPVVAAASPGFGTLWHAMRRCWPLALALGLLGGVLASMATWFLAPGRYTASALVHISSASPRGASEGDFAAYQRTQAAIIKSPSVIRKALDKPGISELREVYAQSDPDTWLMKNLVTDFNQGPELLRVNLSGDYPADLALILNAVCKAFVDDCALREEKKIVERKKQTEAGLKEAAKALSDARNKFNKRKDELNIEDPKTLEFSLDIALKAQAAAQQKLSETRDKIKEVKSEMISPSDASIDKEIEADPVGKKQFEVFADQLKKVEEQIAGVMKAAVNPDKELGLYRQIRQNALEGMKKVREELRPRMATRVKERLGQELKSLEQKEKDQEAEVNRAKEETNAVKISGYRNNTKALNELKALEDDVNQAVLTHTKITNELADLEVERTSGHRITVGQEAVPPQNRNDRMLKLTAGAGLGVFGLIALCVTWLELRTRRVYESADVSWGLGVRVLGSLPAPSGSATVTPAGLNGLTPQTEAVDGIRTLLLHGQGDHFPRVILVTSAERGEGKTSLAGHLAASLSRSWRKTLLIDGDLRNPAAHKLFNLPGEPGFSEALRADADFDAAVLPSPLSRLWLLPAGRCDAHAVQALAQDTLGSAVEQFKEQYDFLVLDAGPVLSAADTLLLAQHADAVLLAVRKDVSRVPTVQAARERLKAVGINVFGAVVVGEKPDNTSFSGQVESPPTA